MALVSPATGTPTGSVSFTDDGNPVAGCQSVACRRRPRCRLRAPRPSPSGATHSIVASYSGDTDDAASTASLLQSIGQIPTQTAVTSSSPDVDLRPEHRAHGHRGSERRGGGDARAARSPSTTTSRIPLERRPSRRPAARPPPTSRSRASWVVSTPSPPPTAAIRPSASSSSDPPVDVNVAEAPTTVTVAGSARSDRSRPDRRFTATITSSASGETGTVQFVDNGLMIGSGTVSGGQATFQTCVARARSTSDHRGLRGRRRLRRQLIDEHGDADRRPRRSTSTEVAGRPRARRWSDSPSPTRATVTVGAPGSGSPTGSVSFSDAGTPIAGCQGLALPAAPAGRGHVLPGLRHERQCRTSRRPTAATPSFTASAGAHGGDRRSRCPTTTRVVPSPSASTAGQSVTLTATVAPTTGVADPRRNRDLQRQRDAARHLYAVRRLTA